MTREQLLSIFKENDVKYDTGIEKQDTEGFVNDECEKYAQTLYGDLYKIAAYGMQSGFSKAAEDDIKELTKLISSLIAGTSRKAVNLAQTEDRRQQILKKANYLRKEINMEMIEQLTANLNACVNAADSIMIIRKDNESLCAKLNESKEVLQEIKKTLSDVADATSKNAAEYQVAIFEALMDWRDAVSRYQCYTDTVDGLRGALDKAREWQKLTQSARHAAKMNVDFYEYHDDCDDISFIISAAKYAERTEGMRDHLNSFRTQTKQLYSVETLQTELTAVQEKFFAQRDQINNRLAEIKEETDKVLAAYQNGEMDAVAADVKVSDLDGEAADLQDELADAQEDFGYETDDLKAQIRDAQSGSKVRDKIAKNFEDFVKKIEAYRDTDPAMFVMLCSRIDFNGVYDTLSGRLTDKQIEEVYTAVETVIRETEEDVKRQRRNLTGFNAINDKARERRRQEERVLREQEAARRARLQERRASAAVTNGRATVSNSEEEAKKRLQERLAGRSAGATIKTEEQQKNSNPFDIRNEDK